MSLSNSKLVKIFLSSLFFCFLLVPARSIVERADTESVKKRRILSRGSLSALDIQNKRKTAISEMLKNVKNSATVGETPPERRLKEKKRNLRRGRSRRSRERSLRRRRSGKWVKKRGRWRFVNTPRYKGKWSKVRGQWKYKRQPKGRGKWVRRRGKWYWRAKAVKYKGVLLRPKNWRTGKRDEIEKYIINRKYHPATFKKWYITKLSRNRTTREKLFWWWTYWRPSVIRSSHDRRRREAWWRVYLLNNQRQKELIRLNWKEYLRRWRIKREEDKRQNRESAKMLEQNMLIDVQRAKIKQTDRVKFDHEMAKNRKVDSKIWNRTFLFDAIMMMEKLIYLDHDDMVQQEMAAGRKYESGQVRKYDNFYAEVGEKRNSDWTFKDLEMDLFQD